MPLIDYVDPDALDEETRELLAGMRNAQGEIPAFPRLLAHNPEVLAAAIGQFGTVMYGGRLDPPTKQLAFVVVAQERGSPYCAATHGSELVNASGLPEATLEAVAAGDEGALTDRQRAVVRFARQAATDPEQVGASHLAALTDVGFGTAEIVELLAVAGQAAFATTIADAAGMEPADESPDLERYYPRRGGAVWTPTGPGAPATPRA